MASSADRDSSRGVIKAKSFRRLVRSDTDCVLDMWLKTHRTHLTLRYSNIARCGRREWASQICDENIERAFTIGAFDRATLIGMITLAFGLDERDAEVALIVRSDLQRQGLGTALMARAIEAASARGVKVIWGQAFAENAPVLKLAKRLGANIKFLEETLCVVRAVLNLDETKAPFHCNSSQLEA